MNEQFDKELRNHIKDTFGAFDDHLADDGWRKLNDRKKKKRRAFFLWYFLPSGIAAGVAFLLFFNLGGYSFFGKDEIVNQEEIVANGLSNRKSENKNIETEKSNPKSINPSRKSNSKSAGEIAKTNVEAIAESSYDESKKAIQTSDRIEKNSIKEIDNITTENSLAKNSVINKTTNDDISNENFESKPINNNSNQITSEKETILVIKNIQTQVLDPTFNTDSSSNYIRENIGEIYAQERNFISPKSSENQRLFPKSIDNKSNPNADKLALANQDVAENKDKKSNQLGKKFKIGIDANTYFNFNENGLHDRLNIGFGLVSEYKLTNKLSINSGVAINSQNSVFNGSQKSNQDFQNSRFAASNIAAVPSAQVTNAKLVGLDIPLNIKYQLQFGKTKSFLSTGLSSYSVINERYNNEFSVINYSFTGAKTSSVSSVVDNPKGQFSYFKFARTLDVSFGILYPLSKKNTLSIEPFMKYPLSGLGYQDLKIGASGLSFKMNFGQ